MKNNENYRILPVQPYLAIHMDNYEKQVENCYGISQFYEFTVNDSYQNQLQAVPDGSVDVLFGISDKEVRTYIGGTVLKAKNWPVLAGNTYFGVRFQPGKCILPKDLSIDEIVDTDLEISGDSFGRNLSEKIAEGKTMKERAGIFLEHYEAKVRKGVEQNGVNVLEAYMRKRIYECRGNITMKQLAEETGYSECYVRRGFEKIHGISPKLFAKFVRFQNVLNQIHNRTDEDNMEKIALECGYYDQSHMMKDFKCFTGITPEAYWNMILEKGISQLLKS